MRISSEYGACQTGDQCAWGFPDNTGKHASWIKQDSEPNGRKKPTSTKIVAKDLVGSGMPSITAAFNHTYESENRWKK